MPLANPALPAQPVAARAATPPPQLRISASEQKRLAECAREPIRTPGATQPHGSVIIVDAESFEVVSASANANAVLGSHPVGMLGHPLEDVIGSGPVELLREILDAGSAASNPALMAIGGKPFDAIVRRTGDLVIVDLEPTLAQTETQSTSALFAAIGRLGRIATAPELWAESAREIRRITQYDRVMIYHFHPDAHGEVMAEEVADGMEPYLGLHYPASDIPAQARELYRSQLSRVIGDSGGTPVELLGLDDPGGIDLSHSELRSVSVHHLGFMRNMGQASTVSFSLMHKGELIGMITCAHRTPRRLPYVVRKGFEVLASQVAQQLSSLSSIERLTRRVAVRRIRSDLVQQLRDDTDIPRALLYGGAEGQPKARHPSPTILDLVPADGAVIRMDGRSQAVGVTPPVDELEALTAALRARELGFSFFVTNSLPLDHPRLAALAPSVTGMLLVPIGGEGDFVGWFRAELVQNVTWLGDQSASNRITPLSPRNSFSAWSQDVTGTSLSWDGIETEAGELGRDLDSALFRRAESKLAHFAMHDSLTGLPNRRLLMDRLNQALARYARGEDIALLFVDLDGFKAVNDTLGHDAGDAVLVRTANQLTSIMRTTDTVARLGGDEFVILCEGTTPEEADIVADRIVAAIRSPSLTGYAEAVLVTASVGITSADVSFGATDLLRQADAAMYRAKDRGRNRVSR